MAAPVPVTIIFGDYCAAGMAQDSGDSDVINSKKSVPIQFMSGYTDVLRVDKVKCKGGSEGNVGSLTVQGAIATEETYNFVDESVTIHWGSGEYVIDPGGFVDKGNGKYVCKKKPDDTDRTKVSVTIDTNKCTFKVVLKNTYIDWQASPVVFGLELGTFNQAEEAVFN